MEARVRYSIAYVLSVASFAWLYVEKFNSDRGKKGGGYVPSSAIVLIVCLSLV